MVNNFPFSSPEATHTESVGFEVHTNLNPKRSWKKSVKNNFTPAKKKITVTDQKKVQTPGLNAGTNNDAFFPKYNQFKNKPKEAIKHLLKVKKGDCLNALYRKDIGFIDIVWGENDSKNKGFGLKHIVEKHGKEIEQLGFKLEDFLPIVIQNGVFVKSEQKEGRILLEGSMFRVVVEKTKEKTFLLTAFDLRPIWKKEKSSGLNGTYDGINFTNKPMLYSTLDYKKLRKTNKIVDGVNFTKPPLYSKTLTSTNKDTKKGLNSPNVSKKEKVETETSVKIPVNVDKNSLAYKMANQSKDVEYFSIPDAALSRLLGKIEKKKKESVFISLTGSEGSMKTRMAFQFMNTFAQNYKVGHASIEEHPESVLYFDKAKQYLDIKAQGNITNPEVNNLSSLHNLIMKNDVIVIDSFTKMKEIEKTFEVDRDLRKKYNGKLFIVIFQQTTNNTMRGGSKSQFDADVVLFTEKFDNYKQNYVYATKNRYSSETGLKFNIYAKQLQGAKSEKKAEVQPKTKKLSFKVK